jgi:hypothetical protein
LRAGDPLPDEPLRSLIVYPKAARINRNA